MEQLILSCSCNDKNCTNYFVIEEGRTRHSLEFHASANYDVRIYINKDHAASLRDALTAYLQDK